MPRSMTGFGTAHAVEDGCRYTVEIRSVNGRFLKCVVRLPEALHGLEADIEQAVAGVLRRGSVTVVVRFVDESASAAADINMAALESYMDRLGPLAEKSGQRLDIAQCVMLPGVIATDTAGDQHQSARPTVLRLVQNACHDVESMRTREGEALSSDISQHLDAIEARLGKIRDRVPQVNDQFQERLRQRMEALLSQSDAEVREEDLMREVAIFAERSDIAEEVARLSAHIEQFREILSKQDDLIGRTLDFLAQEMLREANTIGSKCLDTDVGREIVCIKGEVDRVKEQVQNLE